MVMSTSESVTDSHRSSEAVSPFLRILTTARRIDLDPDGPTVSVVVPTRNEERNLDWLARHMPANVFEIIVVDGGSSDGTVATARELWADAKIVNQTRRGKGNALACGFHAATGDIIVMIDADGSMDPGEIPYFVEHLRAGADYAKGSRFTIGGGSGDITALRAWGNRRLNGVTALVHGTDYSDLCYGYNAFWRRILPILDMDPGVAGTRSNERLWGDGFEVETLINIRVHAAKLKIAEVASYEFERLFGTSNLNTFRDGARVLRTIALEKVVRRRHALRLASGAGTASALPLAGSVFPDPTSDDPAVPLHEPSIGAAVAGAVVAALPDALRPSSAGAGVFDGADLADLDGSGTHELDTIGVELAEAELEFKSARSRS